MTLAIVYGTRPEAIKTGPIAAELRLLGVPFHLICTGQHTDLLQGTPVETDLALASESLALASSGRVWSWVWNTSGAIQDALVRLGASAVLVQGDTMSALAGARAAKALALPLYHVEAGVRSHNVHEPYPEERIRMQITQLARWHYAPTSHAVENLRAESVPEDAIVLTGNPVVSAMARYSGVGPSEDDNASILITMHRREALNSLAIAHCFAAAQRWSLENPGCGVTWVLHPAVAAHLGFAWVDSGSFSAVGPAPYGEMLRALAGARGIVTDSGGLQEEAATLGVPCAVVRNVTDRPESIAAGVAQLFPPTPGGITAALDALWARQLPRSATNCFGDAQSAARIASHLAQTLPKEIAKQLVQQDYTSVSVPKPFG